MISIILPTYKEAVYLRRAIESVMRQSYQEWELLVVDDGLVPAAKNIVQEYIQKDSRVQCITTTGMTGIQRSLNRGLVVAMGDYIARIDDDDEWVDVDKLKKQIAFLEENPEYVLVGTNGSIVTEKGVVLAVYVLPQTDAEIRSRILSKNCFLHPSIVARKDAIEHAGNYGESRSVQHIEDYALWLALGTEGKYANLPFNGVALTVHTGSLTFQHRLSQARRMRSIIGQYKQEYPRFIFSYILLSIRVIGFAILNIIPIPTKVLYVLQKVYKEY
jgi:glycosyltransferase involved in cell wall biosynthesis